MKILLIVTTILISVWLCAASSQNLLRRQRRSISESTRFHNEYDSVDPRGHRGHRNVDTSPKECVPVTRWKNDCNTCWCSETGLAACTLMGCLHFDENRNSLANSHRRQPIFGHTVSRNSIQEQGDKHTRVRRSEDNSGKCIPGTSWKQDCNSCWCTDSGVGFCTLKGCLHFDNFLKPVQPTISNRRKRSSSGTTSTRFLNSPPENGKMCNPGTTWMNGCNRCRCFGGRAACTRMMCFDKVGNF